MKAFRSLFLSTLLPFTSCLPVSAESLPPGCMEMNGKVQCIERQGKPTPKWRQDLGQKQALNDNCHQWIELYRANPTGENKEYRDLACRRSAEKKISISDQVHEIFYGTPPKK